MQRYKIPAQFTRSMTSLERNLCIFCVLFLTAIYSILYEPALAAAPDGHSTLAQNSQRFMKLNQQGKPFSESSKDQTWSCVLDKQTGLIWEIKSNNGDIQDAQQTYSWYETNPALNGGFAGYENKGKCVLSLCNTQAYITAINQKRICGSAQWRLPTREELRSIVDYKIKYPGPTINRVYFPNAINQFYWSSVPNANDKDSAWGIGFSFGYDYAYFKSDLGYIRLVSEHNK